MKRLIALFLFLALPLTVSGHGDEDHSGGKADENAEWETISEEIPQSILKGINSSYLKNIKPIFQSKCLDCHGNVESLPWYSNLPGAKQLIRDDISEAKEHMDMSNDFPFSGHGTPQNDLEALERSINENSMPPLRYKVMHWDSGLESDEKSVIKAWIKKSIHLINLKKEE